MPKYLLFILILNSFLLINTNINSQTACNFIERNVISSTKFPENSIAIDPIHTNVLLSADGKDNGPNGSLRIFRSSTNGTNWDLVHVTGNSCHDPAVQIDLNGYLYVYYITSSFHIMIDISTDNGLTWNTETISNLLADQPFIWVDNISTGIYSN